ncbi:MAG: hypothetical protein Q9172_000422 [Xanthocarpia lactea]
MEEFNHSDMDEQFDEDSTNDLRSPRRTTYPDPETVVGNTWWSKAHLPPGPAVGSQLETNPDLTEYVVTASDASGSEGPESRFADPGPVGRDEDRLGSDFALSEEDGSDESLSGLSHSSSEDNRTETQALTIKRRGRPRGRGRCAESSRGRRALARRSQKGIKRGYRKPLEPSNEFKSLHAQATMAFIDADYELAEQLTLQAILLNPEMYAAHSLLSEIHKARGEHDKALAALFNGAHTSHRNPEPWFTIARRILQRAEHDDDNSSLRDALYCYNRILMVDPGNIDALHKRAPLRRQLGYKRRAADDYEHLLRLEPHDVDVLRSLAAIYTEMDKPQRAIELYNESILHYQSIEMGQIIDFSWSDINIYVELFAYQQRYAEAVMNLKSLSRWLLGRRSSSGSDMPPELHIKLGIYRLKSRDCQVEEATAEFELLNPQDTSSKANLYDYPDLFRDAADALRGTGNYHEALRYYEPLQEVPEFVDTSYYADMAACYRAVGRETEADNCYRIIASLEKDQTDKTTTLAGMESDVMDMDESTTAGSSGKAATSRVPPALAMLISHRSKQRTRRSDLDKELRARFQEETTRALYAQSQAILDQARKENPEAIAQWMAISQELVDDFQAHRGFFPSDKGLKVYGRPQDGGDPEIDAAVAAGDYRGIPFSSWLDLMLEYAVLAARSQNSAKAYEILKIADDANVFYCSPDSMFLIHPGSIAYRRLACALMVSDHEMSCSVARWFMKEFQFVTDGYRLFSAVNRLCDGGNRWFNSSPSQKYVLRQLKAMDHSLVGQSQHRTCFQEKASYTTIDDEGNPIQASEMDLSLLMLTDLHGVTGDDFAVEAAFALRNIWAADEQTAKVLEITYKYLVI